MEWINVKDRMPKQGEVVLLYQTYPPDSIFHCRADPLPRNFYSVGGLRYDKKFISNKDQYSQIGLEHVSHWMPLPDKPID